MDFFMVCSDGFNVFSLVDIPEEVEHISKLLLGWIIMPAFLSVISVQNFFKYSVQEPLVFFQVFKLRNESNLFNF